MEHRLFGESDEPSTLMLKTKNVVDVKYHRVRSLISDEMVEVEKIGADFHLPSS